MKRAATPAFRPAEAIPLEAAGRQPLFLYGTLLDKDVLSCVLDRALRPGTLVPASLPGFRREAARDLPYPLLVIDRKAEVHGQLLLDLSPRDIVRVNHYESGEYCAALHRTRHAGDEVVAWVFLALEARLLPSGRPWDLAAWAKLHKRGFLATCAALMADCA